MTIVDWIDVFSRKEQRDIIIEALRYCIKHKGLNVYAYCIMTNHIHMILNCNEPFKLKDTVRDFKKYTSKSIVNEISNGIESRKEWLLAAFARAAKDSTKNKTYKVWKPGNHAIELWQEKFTWDKIKYIHQNPVKAGFVKSIEDWFYSSASNYMDMENNALEEVSCVSVPFKTIK